MTDGNNALVFAGYAGANRAFTEVLNAVQEEHSRSRQPTQEEKLRDAITFMLGQLGGLTVQDDSLQFRGEEFVLPAQYEGKVQSAIDFLRNYIKQQEQKFEYSREMLYRPYDGAHAFMSVMKTITGTTGFGQTKLTFFGPQHPQFLSINIDHKTVVQVPWGEVHFPSYEAVFEVGYTYHADHGIVFQLGATAPRKYRKHVEAIFRLVEEHLKTTSIYRGKALNGAEHPEFLDVSTVDPNKVVYSQDVLEQLAANVWTPIRYTDQMRALGIPLKRAILFAGPYGVGKSLGGMLTAQEAVAHGWTFIMCRTGKDNPADVLRTAELYAPAVVVVEDVDLHTSGGSSADISRMLEMLDGIVNKGKEVIALFTTNHLDKIQKGALRPGRIDAIIEISGLDEAGFKKLVALTIGADYLADDVDWAEVAKAFEGFLPAFVVEAARRSQRFAMSRNEGRPGVMTTRDLINAAHSLRPQLDLMDGAKEGANRHTLTDNVREVIEDVVGRSRVVGWSEPLQVTPATLLNGGKEKG